MANFRQKRVSISCGKQRGAGAVPRTAARDALFRFSSVYKGVERTRIDEEKLRPLLVRQAESYGTRRYHRPLWLIRSGPAAMDWAEFWQVYLKRFCLECVHQFTKNSLCWTRGRFGHTGREERWSWMVMLAYWMLLLAAPAARDICRPWE